MSKVTNVSRFQTLLHEHYQVDKVTVYLMEQANVKTGQGFMHYHNGAMGQAIKADDFGAIAVEVRHMLSVACGIPVAQHKVSDTTGLANAAHLMQELMKKERDSEIASLSGVGSHASEQFPPEVSSTEAKIDYSVTYMIDKWQQTNFTLKPSSRPDNKLLKPLLRFTLWKTGYGALYTELGTQPPDFARMAKRLGAQEETLAHGGTHSLTATVAGSVVEPGGMIELRALWNEWLHYCEAVTRIKLPSGDVYGDKQGFEVLRGCFEKHVGDLRSVKAMCESLNNGWRAFTDRLAMKPNETFMQVCEQIESSDKAWVPKADKVKQDDDWTGGRGGGWGSRKQRRNAARGSGQWYGPGAMEAYLGSPVPWMPGKGGKGGKGKGGKGGAGKMPRDGMCHKEMIHGACVEPGCQWGHAKWRGSSGFQPQYGAPLPLPMAPPGMAPPFPQMPPGMPPPMMPNPMAGKGTHAGGKGFGG